MAGGTKSLYLRKIKDIRYRHGDEAVEHFKQFPFCQKCNEERLVCLAMHHLEGKHADLFQTLCHNCHQAYHAGKSGEITYKDELKWFEKKEHEKQERIARNKKIIELYNKEFSTTYLSMMFDLSRKRIREIVKENLAKESKESNNFTDSSNIEPDI